MKKKIIETCLVVLGLMVSGCSTQIVKLETLEDKDYYKGREIVTKEKDSVRVSVEVDSYKGNEAVFYVQVENESSRKILVEPKDFYVEVVEKDLLSVNKRFRRLYALYPEKQIQKINGDMESRSTVHGVVTGLNLFFALVSVVADITDKDDENDLHEVSRDIGMWADNQISEEIDYNTSMNEYESQEEFWKNEVLRITDLYQNDRIGGLVFVPVDPRAEYLRFTIPVESGTFTFLYKKVIVK